MTTPLQQMTAISAQLSVDLATVTDDRLIELCLLYRSEPDAYRAFADNLKEEIIRRFTAEEIANNDVMFSVIKNLSNQFSSTIPYFAKKMLEMAASVNRDIWFTNNLALFTDATNNSDLMAWLVTQPDVLTKALHNQIALPILAQSTIAATAILTDVNAVALFKDTPNVWATWTQHSAGMTVIAQSSELMTYVINNTVAMTAVIASSTAMTAVASSSTAMTAVIASSTAMTAVASSSTAMTAVASSSTAMTAVAASSVALSAIVKSTSARNALMSSNTILQNNRVAIYNTIKVNWTKQAGISQAVGANYSMTSIDNAVVSPAGFVFASLGFFTSYATGISNITHPNGVLAAAKGTSSSPTTLANLDVVSFNGATFKATINSAQAYAELWIPPAI